MCSVIFERQLDLLVRLALIAVLDVHCCCLYIVADNLRELWTLLLRLILQSGISMLLVTEFVILVCYPRADILYFEVLSYCFYYRVDLHPYLRDTGMLSCYKWYEVKKDNSNTFVCFLLSELLLCSLCIPLLYIYSVCISFFIFFLYTIKKSVIF